MNNNTHITGIILAGGAGRRMGNVDKGLVEWNGEPLIQHVISRLQPQVDELLISCNRNHRQYRQWAANTVSDARDGYQGPLAGLEACASRVNTDYALIVPCDMPLLPGDLGARLTGVLAARPDLVMSYAHDGTRDQYLCAAIRRHTLRGVSSFLDQGKRAVRQWYASQATISVDCSDIAGAFRNINTL